MALRTNAYFNLHAVYIQKGLYELSLFLSTCHISKLLAKV